MDSEKKTFPALCVIEPQAFHTHTAIMLHGRASSGPEFAQNLASCKSSSGQSLASHFPGWRWVFPSACTRWSPQFEQDLRDWFDVWSLSDPNERQDFQVESLRDSSLYVLDVLEQEIARLGGRSEKVILGGMSIGMATALWTLLCTSGRVKGRLGAFIGACGWIPLTQHIEAAVHIYRTRYATEFQTNKCLTISAFLLGSIRCRPFESSPREIEALLSTPVLLLHGTDDTIVDVSLGRRACQLLKDVGMDVELFEYSGAERAGHWIKEPEGFDRIVEFLKSNTD